MGSTTPPSKFNVALIQTCPKPNDPATNFLHAASQIRAAAASSSSKEGISLAILPEYHLTAFEPSSPLFIPCCQTSHIYISKYQSLAAELKISICAGTIVLTPEPEDPELVKYEGENEGPTLLNTSYFIGPSGEILGSYTKTNLWHPEREHLTSSIEHHGRQGESDSLASSDRLPKAKEESLPEPHQVIETPLGKVGIVVCWDIAFPEAFRSLIQAGANIILAPTFWTEGDMIEEGRKYNSKAEELFLRNTLVSRAFENTCAVIFCNAGGPASEGFIGISQVALPIVGMVKPSFENSEEGYRVVEVDMKIVEIAEENYKIREDLRREDWHYGYSK